MEYLEYLKYCIPVLVTSIWRKSKVSDGVDLKDPHNLLGVGSTAVWRGDQWSGENSIVKNITQTTKRGDKWQASARQISAGDVESQGFQP